MKKLLLLLGLFGFVLFTGCEQKSATPAEVLNQFLDAVKHNDFSKARSLVTAESIPTFITMEWTLQNNKEQNNISLDSVVVDTESTIITGDSATVKAIELKNGEAIPFILKKEIGGWKVSLQKADIAEMINSKIKEKIDSAMITKDSLLNKIGDLADSTAEKLNNGIKKLDSLGKNIQIKL
ncbi:MAG TPA: DUF4878 domain-containing protein [Ferruginibacter sp.]|nr:DUF4878 domain-containing protein [Niastella sp.]HRB31025.1 DUF4878 domain-containing protein [Ferruginibacter sp.]